MTHSHHSSSAEGHLACFPFLEVTSALVTGTAARRAEGGTGKQTVTSFTHFPRSGVTGSHGRFISSILRILLSYFQNGWITLQPHQQRMRVLFPTTSPAFVGGCFVDLCNSYWGKKGRKNNTNLVSKKNIQILGNIVANEP